MRARTVLFATVAVLILLMTPVGTDTSDANQSMSGDITWYGKDSVDLRANTSESFTLSIYNESTSALHVHLSANSVNDTSVKLSETDITLKPKGTDGDRAYVTVSLNASKYASDSVNDFEITMSIYNMVDGASETVLCKTKVTVNSTYADGDAMGKILGIFKNPFPAPLNSLEYTAVLTLGIWILISMITSSLVRISMQFIVNKLTHYNSKKKIVDVSPFKKTWKYVFMIVIMYGLENTMVIVGVEDAIIGSFKDFTDILTVIFLGMMAWHIFTVVASILSDKMSGDDAESSLKPLILLIGRIAIVLITFFILMGISGIEMASLALAVGLGATGLSFGAKTVITQFFCGLQIMILRTFRAGDKIKVGADTATLIVEEVGIMTTRCKNWSNEEIFYIPNSTMSDQKIVNITADNVYYKVYDYYTIDHKADINLAREVMIEVAYQDEGVVADGSFSKPEVRFDTANYNEISLRLAYTVVDHDDYGVISARIRKRILERFAEEGIDIPYPQYTINVIPPRDVTPE